MPSPRTPQEEEMFVTQAFMMRSNCFPTARSFYCQMTWNWWQFLRSGLQDMNLGHMAGYQNTNLDVGLFSPGNREEGKYHTFECLAIGYIFMDFASQYGPMPDALHREWMNSDGFARALLHGNWRQSHVPLRALGLLRIYMGYYISMLADMSVLPFGEWMQQNVDDDQLRTDYILSLLPAAMED
jgi:hypothetical protein